MSKYTNIKKVGHIGVAVEKSATAILDYQVSKRPAHLVRDVSLQQGSFQHKKWCSWNCTYPNGCCGSGSHVCSMFLYKCVLYREIHDLITITEPLFSGTVKIL